MNVHEHYRGVQIKALAVVRETMMAVEFAEQAHACIHGAALQSAIDAEIESAQNAVSTAVLLLEELAELLNAMPPENEAA